MFVVNAFSKEKEASPKKQSPKSGNELFCSSIVIEGAKTKVSFFKTYVLRKQKKLKRKNKPCSLSRGVSFLHI